MSESQNTVEVCAIVYSPDIDRPVAFPFDVILIGHGGINNVTTMTVPCGKGMKHLCRPRERTACLGPNVPVPKTKLFMWFISYQ